MQPPKHSREPEIFPTRRVAIVDGDREAAEMLHMFLRLMELECSIVNPSPDPLPTLRRLDADILILDLDLPDLQAQEIAREIGIPVLYLTEGDPTRFTVDAPVMRKPRDRYEDLLGVFEAVLNL